jgi:hypothetical protein
MFEIRGRFGKRKLCGVFFWQAIGFFFTGDGYRRGDRVG